MESSQNSGPLSAGQTFYDNIRKCDPQFHSHRKMGGKREEILAKTNFAGMAPKVAKYVAVIEETV